MHTKLLTSAIAIAALSASAAIAREQVQIAGSSTVLPYATIVAEAFGENTDFPTPVVESGGSSAGLKKFCEGVGEGTIDIANASRAIKSSEVETCKANGVTDILEVRIGYDGIVFASDIDGNVFQFTPQDWYRALAANVVVDGKIEANPYTMWNQVRADLPAQEIQAFIPGTKHGTREVFEVKVLEAGCEASGAMDVLKAANGGDKTDKLQVATMNEVLPTTETIATGEYPVSRPLYFYIKTQHIGVIPGLKEYAEFFVSDDMAGPDGPLASYGLVSDPKLADTQAQVANAGN